MIGCIHFFHSVIGFVFELVPAHDFDIGYARTKPCIGKAFNPTAAMISNELLLRIAFFRVCGFLAVSFLGLIRLILRIRYLDRHISRSFYLKDSVSMREREREKGSSRRKIRIYHFVAIKRT